MYGTAWLCRTNVLCIRTRARTDTLRAIMRAIPYAIRFYFHSSCKLVPAHETLVQPRANFHKVPHIGWNNMEVVEQHLITKKLEEECFFYFAHSFYVKTALNIIFLVPIEYLSFLIYN